MTHTFDATNQSMGRLASKVAYALRGKTSPAYQPHILPTEKVLITNIQKLKFTGHKLQKKVYYRYSGFPGGIYSQTLETAFDKNPKKVFRSAVYAMLAKNRLRDKIIKNLEIK